jgi:hypothetical protein
VLKLRAVFLPLFFYCSSAMGAEPIVLRFTDGVPGNVTGTVSGSETARYNFVLTKGKSVSIELSSANINSCTLGIVQPLNSKLLFDAGGRGTSTYKNAEIADRTIQVIAYPSRSGFVNKELCEFTVSYQVN